MTPRRYFRIAVNLTQIGECYDYHLPEDLEQQNPEAGALVLVPFGSQTVQGVVVEKVIQPMVSETRPILEVLDEKAVLNAHLLTLSLRMSEETFSPLGEWIGLLLPTGLEQKLDRLYRWSGGEPDFALSPLQKRIKSQLDKRGTLRGQQLTHHFGSLDWREAMQTLIRRGLVSATPILTQKKVQPKRVLTAELAVSLDEGQSILEKTKRRSPASFERQMKVLEFLAKENKAVAVQWVYAASGANLSDLKKLETMGVISLQRQETWRNPLEKLDFESQPPLALTSAQSEGWEKIKSALHSAWNGERQRPILLEGVTGSGKTELYLYAVAETLQAEKQAIVLVPEIALTPQTIRRFLSRFSDKVAIYHSRLSPGERYDTWQRVRNGQISVAVGPRSTLFLPFKNPGLVVIDECHDESYYQKQSPNYHTVQAAITYMEITGGVCLLGSATPTIEQSYLARLGKWQRLLLPQRILAHQDLIERERRRHNADDTLPPSREDHPLPMVNVVDMREELKSGNRSIFSRLLRSRLEKVLSNGEQAILYINRRGMATYVFCRSCGTSLVCPRCQIPLTFHIRHDPTLSSERLYCHHCGYQRSVPQKCPTCGSSHIRHFGLGTEKVEQEVKQFYPQARVLRWDFETARKKGAHEEIWGHFAERKADVLIGTQMLAKGLDLPYVTLVGVILAEVGLNLPDYRAGERTFQLLLQVAGRAGRSPLGGEVVFQTYQPDHYVIAAAAEQEYELFYQQELALRKKTQYPPFARLVRLEFRHLNESKAEAEAERVAEELHSRMKEADLKSVRMIGPLPCFFRKENNFFRWQVILAGDHPEMLIRTLRLRNGWRVELDPISLL